MMKIVLGFARIFGILDGETMDISRWHIGTEIAGWIQNSQCGESMGRNNFYLASSENYIVLGLVISTLLFSTFILERGIVSRTI
ncbi:MAG TPA: hypothetical protein VH796_15090 [Nitrososphaeraceae archaeon]|jgi:hypothetical protein